MAAKASTKMLIPLFLFIFPVVFILALGPIIAGLVKGGLFGG
jgi:tight adherence protein C